MILNSFKKIDPEKLKNNELLSNKEYDETTTKIVLSLVKGKKANVILKNYDYFNCVKSAIMIADMTADTSLSSIRTYRYGGARLAVKKILEDMRKKKLKDLPADIELYSNKIEPPVKYKNDDDHSMHERLEFCLQHIIVGESPLKYFKAFQSGSTQQEIADQHNVTVQAVSSGINQVINELVKQNAI